MKQLALLIPDAQTTMSTVACIVGSHQLFAEANVQYQRLGREPVFSVHLVSASPEKALHHGFISVRADRTLKECPEPDLILIPASLIRGYATATTHNRQLIDWVKQQYQQGAEVASMCAGGFTLAATGLLQGRSCATHWALAEDFRVLFPEVALQPDQLITDQAGLYTNGGAYSFLHLLLYLVQKFYDRPTAIHCAKYFQVDLDRQGQSPFMIFRGHKKHQDAQILEAQEHLEAHYAETLSIADLATSLGLGRRSFDRRFIKATGLRPGDYVQRLKVEAAKKLLESTPKTVNEVMFDVGYTDSKAFREVFGRITGTTPRSYKEKYNGG